MAGPGICHGDAEAEGHEQAERVGRTEFHHRAKRFILPHLWYKNYLKYGIVYICETP
jgi:hypothetical protein